MSRLPILGVIVAMAIAVLAAPSARAQMDSREGIALQNQILELRHELDQLRQQGFQGGAAPTYEQPPVTSSPQGGDISAQLLDRVSQLEDQVRQLRGRIDEIDNARTQAEADLGKQIGDLQFKLNGGLGPGSPPAVAPGPSLSAPPLAGRTSNAGPAAAPPPAAGAIPPPQRRTPEIALAAGNAALARHDYATAEASARDALSAGRGPRTADAQYLLAQALAGQRNYPAAAVAYDDSYQRNPRGNRAQDSLIGLANALTQIGDKTAACQTLDKLRVEYAHPRPDLRASIAAARGRAGCR